MAFAKLPDTQFSIKMLQKLPLSYADFRTLRQENYKYVDKTEYIYKIADGGQMYFLSRPRRFGKLAISLRETPKVCTIRFLRINL